MLAVVAASIIQLHERIDSSQESTDSPFKTSAFESAIDNSVAHELRANRKDSTPKMWALYALRIDRKLRDRILLDPRVGLRCMQRLLVQHIDAVDKTVAAGIMRVYEQHIAFAGLDSDILKNCLGLILPALTSTSDLPEHFIRASFCLFRTAIVRKAIASSELTDLNKAACQVLMLQLGGRAVIAVLRYLACAAPSIDSLSELNLRLVLNSWFDYFSLLPNQPAWGQPVGGNSPGPYSLRVSSAYAQYFTSMTSSETAKAEFIRITDMWTTLQDFIMRYEGLADTRSIDFSHTH